MWKRKERRQLSKGTEELTNKVAGKIHHWIYQVQSRFAIFMSKYEQRLSVRQKKKWLIIFCLCMSALSTFWLYESIYHTNGTNHGYLKKNSIVTPTSTELPDSLDLKLWEEINKHHSRSVVTDSITK